MVNAIGTLCAYAFLTPRNSDDFYDMHRLVHIATKVWLRSYGVIEGSQDSTAAHLATRLRSSSISGVWEEQREYFPHAIHFLQQPKFSDNETRYNLCSRVVIALGREERFKERLKWALCLHSWCQSHLDREHPDRLRSQRYLADAYGQDGQFGQEVGVLEEVVAIQDTLLPDDDLDRLEAQCELGQAYLSNGEVQCARQLERKIVDVLEPTNFKEDEPRCLNLLQFLANMCLSNAEFLQARRLMEKVVFLKQSSLPEGDLSYLESAHKLGRAYRLNGEVARAVEFMERVVTSQKHHLPDYHPLLLESQLDLALACWDFGQIERALQLVEHVVPLHRQFSEEDNPVLTAAESFLLVLQESFQEMNT